MTRLVAGWLVGLGTMLIGHLYAQGPAMEQIHPPFGLSWGQTQKSIENLFSQSGAKIVNRALIQGRDAWTVEGLAQPGLKRAIVYFGTGKTLVEVELQYEHPDWDLVAYEAFLNSARKRLESKYGPPVTLARYKKPEGDVMETVVGYQWQQAKSSLELFFYSAERNADIYRTVSLHYRAG
jgi:hypothetical protein